MNITILEAIGLLIQRHGRLVAFDLTYQGIIKARWTEVRKTDHYGPWLDAIKQRNELIVIRFGVRPKWDIFYIFARELPYYRERGW